MLLFNNDPESLLDSRAATNRLHPNCCSVCLGMVSLPNLFTLVYGREDNIVPALVTAAAACLFNPFPAAVRIARPYASSS